MVSVNYAQGAVASWRAPPQFRNYGIQISVDPDKNRLQRHSASENDPTQKLLHHAVDFPLPQQPSFTLIGLVTLAQFEQGHRYRAVLAIPLDVVVFCESIAKN